MKNKIGLAIILSVFSLFENLHARGVITLFLQPYAAIMDHEQAQAMAKKLENPLKTAKLRLKSLDQSALIHGIISTYGGFLSISNNDGQTTFSRLHTEPMVYIIITPEIAPMLMVGNTIHHWEINPDMPAKMYKVERLHNESEDLYYWHVEEVPLPEDNRLPVESITILAKPDTIFVPQGLSLTEYNINLVLPTMYVKKEIDLNAHALYILNFRQFFGDIRPVHKKSTIRYISLSQT